RRQVPLLGDALLGAGYVLVVGLDLELAAVLLDGEVVGPPFLHRPPPCLHPDGAHRVYGCRHLVAVQHRSAHRCDQADGDDHQAHHHHQLHRGETTAATHSVTSFSEG